MSLFTALIGLDASHNAGQAFQQQQKLQQQALDLQKQQLANYEKYAGESAADRANARQGNTTYGQMGLQDRTQADSYLPNLYSQYARANNLSFTPQQPATPQAPTTATNRTTPNTNRTTPGQAATPAPAQDASQSDPYGLAPAQQQQLNQQVDRINAQRQSAIAQYRAMAAQSGAGPNMAMEQYINEQFDRQAQEATAGFAEQARAQQAQAALNFIQQFTNQRNQGTQQYGQSLDRLLSIGGQALGSAEGGPYGQAANQTQNLAMQQAQIGQYNQQLAQQKMGDIMRLIGYAATGGFSGVGGAPSEPWQQKYMGVY